jgi:hypothetical protein
LAQDPYDDVTQGRKIGADPYDDPTQGRKIGADPYDDPTQVKRSDLSVRRSDQRPIATGRLHPETVSFIDIANPTG